MSVKILKGDCRELLKTLEDKSVDCCVTSPPYFGLRDYGHGDQIGLEKTPDEFVAQLVSVFREVRRVLKDSGTVWLNLGDSYASGGTGGASDSSGLNGGKGVGPLEKIKQGPTITRKPTEGLKAKDLIGIPWRVAFALQADGWYLRQDIIWAKPNPMPESVTDRCTKAHEYIFLLSKSAQYYFDADAIAEDAMAASAERYKYTFANNTEKHAQRVAGGMQNIAWNDGMRESDGKRNKRSVWTVATKPFSQAHFATFPPDLIEPCILAGSSEKGCCEKCGSPMVRDLIKTPATSAKTDRINKDRNDAGRNHFMGASSQTIGWLPSCKCGAPIVPCTILDPFGGAGTTGLVADRLGRNAILIELNPEYATMAIERINGDAPLFGVSAE